MKIPRKTAIIVLIGLVALLVLIALGYNQAWTGFGEFNSPDPQFQRAKTLWDWLQLLIIPIALAGGGAIWAWENSRLEQKKAEDRLLEDRLQAYLTQMGNLILEGKLGTKQGNDRLNALVRVQTLTVLRGLDGLRKGILLQFLYEARLINRTDTIIDLSGADLNSVVLNNARLDDVSLRKANLTNANFELADLHYADLTEADLTGANLQEADLSGATLEEAKLNAANMTQCKLYGALLLRAHLVRANLGGARLDSAVMEGAELWYADLSGATLEETNLTAAGLINANLRRARLKSTVLTAADMNGADLTEANLQKSELSPQQLNLVKSLKNTQMPNGKRHN